ncbi:MAG: PilC/PilY family type IV pilus protein [Steroidobacteraceae bacterium]|nr:hypothetical protein [Nevskiaceae bacterium]MCP5339215.1 hypothetical protein [Nevskiaceae bacterium]MCP5359444.1 hypothetical protein [Nevskiaceae bacterium]MCP5467293.1 hypothetical protein [Nevskiaceae bacterium]MCP5470875.1 hypothetical protein [Nevskiaceae bacterium]
MNPRHPSRLAGPVSAACATLLAAGAADSAPLAVSEIPLFVASGLQPNVLLTIANSNSMDEDASGLAVGSAAADSRSEIARRVARMVVANYGGGLNIGLMAFQQHTTGGDAVRKQFLHSSPYDLSFDPANYDPDYNGPRTGPTRAFREANVSDPGNFYNFNVNLPFYSSVNQGTGFCYSATAHAFNNGEHPVTGPWDSYRCFRNKIGSSDALPVWGNSASETANGWTTYFGTYTFLPTDSDLGQGITDFGRFMAWSYVSPTWFSNGSPGGGYLHVPIAPVTTAQANAINTKLGTSQFVVNGPVNPARPLQNAGLTPLEGTLYTIRDYFAGNLADAARGGPKAAPPNSCGKDYSVILTNGLPSVTRFGVPSSNVTQMLADASAAATAVHTAARPVLNYIVGFALPFGTNPAQLDTIAAAGGTGSSYYATDEATLTSELNRVFNDILIRSGAAGAVALNSGSIQTNSRIFQAKFNTGDWSGQLQAFPINATTGAIEPAVWDAGVVINTQHWDSGRKILSWNPTSAQGIAFRWPANPMAPTATTLNAAQIADLNGDGLGAQRLAYLRGSASNEGTGVTDFRVRNVSKLGDIVNSSPAFVGPPRLNIADSSYVAFKSTYASRPNMIYVGANDGMLHAIDAETGEERFAYVPAAVYPRLSGLTAQGFSHKYLVDGSPVAADIKFGSNWHTLLVSGLAAGGKSLFALDVTNPATVSEATPTSTALWEFSHANLGLTYAQPTIIRLNDGSPGVVVGNGYNNTGTGRASLFIINAQTGALIRELDTGIGNTITPNGLSTPAVIDLDGNGTADYAYAGDLRGNVWKFDLTGNNSSSWSVAFSGSPLFTARDSGGTAQPITSAIEVSRHPQGGLIVLFGTGRYIEAADVSATATQSLYGIRDNGSAVSNRTTLVQQTVIDTQTASGHQYRAVSANTVNWASKDGWYMDLPTAGERVVVDPILRNGRLIVPTTIPSGNVCDAGGYSWLMEIDYLSGGRLNIAAFDVNQDGNVDNTQDSMAFDSAGTMHASGVRLDAIASSPSVIRGFGDDADLENKYLNQSTGGMAQVLESGAPLSNRRMSWRQIL